MSNQGQKPGLSQLEIPGVFFFTWADLESTEFSTMQYSAVKCRHGATRTTGWAALESTVQSWHGPMDRSD
eukprot:7478209-Pyramimonas_sp.AAC.2